MKATHTLLPLLALSVLLNGYLIVIGHIKTREVIHQELLMELESQKAMTIRSQMEQEELLSALRNHIQYEDSYINSNLQLFNLQNEAVHLKNVTNDDLRLVLYYSSQGCKPCNDAQIDSVKRISREFGQDKVLIIEAGADPTGIRNLNRIHRFDALSIYRTDGVGLPSSQNSSPIIFLLDRSLQIHLVYFPDDENKNLSELYYQKIRENQSCYHQLNNYQSLVDFSNH